MSDAYTDVYSHDHPRGNAHGWIQWKGTDVCIDLHCACGTHGHFDGYFMYSVQCDDCGRKYAVGQNVKLIEIDTPKLEEAAKQRWLSDFKPFKDDD